MECKIILEGANRDIRSCESSCAPLKEAACIASPGCRATYVDGQFANCWLSETRPTTPQACAGLDADACADHDDCAAFYLPNVGFSTFDHCADEPAVSFLP